MNRIAELRKTHGLSQTELAKQLGIAQNTLSQYENEYRTPTSRVIMNIAKIFDVSTNYVLGYPEPSKKSNDSSFSLSNVTKVEQAYSTDQVNILISLGWKILHIGVEASTYGDGTFSSGTVFTLGWYGDPSEARFFIPEPAGDEYTNYL